MAVALAPGTAEAVFIKEILRFGTESCRRFGACPPIAPGIPCLVQTHAETF